MIRRPPRSTLFPYTTALPISPVNGGELPADHVLNQAFDREFAERSAVHRLSVAQRSEEHTSELQSRLHLVCRLLLEKKKKRQPGNSARRHRTRDTATHI